MTLITATPRDPLIARDGRASDDNMHSLDWILPSVFAGSLRTLLGKQRGMNFDAAAREALREIFIRGPLPFFNGQIYFPRPADYVVAPDDEKTGKVYAARPLPDGADEGTDLPSGLSPVRLPDSVDEDFKPKKTATFWSAEKMLKWLAKENAEGEKFDDGETLAAPEKDERTHVKIDPRTDAAEESQLFSTTGLDFTHKDGETLLLAAEIIKVGKFAETLKALNVLAPLGGERRLAHWQTSAPEEPIFPPAPERLKNVKTGDKIRMILVTPARFNNGWRPGWLNRDKGLNTIPHTAVKVRLVGAAVERWQPVSGWSYQTGEPKPTRRLAPAGSVYFFEVEQGGDLSGAWLNSVGDREQDDGYGLAIFGRW
ncbi:MAG: type III-B CRISPR module-associated protein Cmr3 [Planctomycetota bacterium]|jgi:CRISPR-associated protein Cmr3|nr:type III-B CRISPR module-associated protein Cmr3 [Planctomycetota bacterium]